MDLESRLNCNESRTTPWTSPQGTGQPVLASGVCDLCKLMWPYSQKRTHLAYHSAVIFLKFFVRFKKGVPCFHFALSTANYIASSRGTPVTRYNDSCGAEKGNLHVCLTVTSLGLHKKDVTSGEEMLHSCGPTGRS